jgi:phospholipase/carboxylesterase
MSSSVSSIDLVVLLHGVGSSGADLARLGAVWGKKLPSLRFASPDGPFAFDGAAMGRQWFSVAGVTVENRPARVAAAAPAFDAVVDAAIAAAGTRIERTVLAGFSQGTIMALDALARGRPFAGILGFSGRMASVVAQRLDRVPVRLVHGEADEVIPVGESEAARERLAAAGARVDLVRLPGEGHGIGPAAAAAGLAFLRGLTGDGREG